MKLTITPTQTRIIILALYTLLPLVGWGQQVIGSFPNMDGGFENQTTGTPATASSIATGAERTDWSVQNTSGTASISNTGGRSGPKFITYGATAARRLQSPTVGNAELVNATSYTVQFFYKSTASPSNGQVGNSPDGTAQPGTYVGLTLTNTSGVWTKVTQSQTSGSSSNSPRYGISIIRFSAASGTDIDVDDFVVYAGAVDNSAPNSPGTVTVSNPTNTTLDVSWGVASGGVDGGGYVVVRYAVNPNVDNDPNQNGIYAVGNTFTNGTGSLTGTVRYIGTGTSFTDNVGLSAGTQYWYKVYTVDKAFNYSNESQGTGTTSVCTTPTNITGLSLTPGNGQITVSWTNPACLDEVMIVAKASSSIIATPTGDGSLYTANLAFGSGTAFDGGHVVYKGAASPQTITGLTNGTTYFVKVFTRRGTTWTSGVESSAVPAIQPIVWSNTGASTAWYTNTNWTPNTNSIQWQTFNVAQFQNSGTATTAGINMNTAQLSIGAIEITAARTRILTIGNSSTTSGTLSLNGAFVNAVDNTVIRNNSNYNLTIQDNETGTGKTMNVALLNATNNIIAADANGNIFISSQITSASGPITITGSGSGIVEFSGQNTYTTETVVAGSTLRLNRTGGNTLPATNNIKVEGGTLRISTSQTINNLTLTGGTITIDPGVTFTINGTVTRTGGSIDASATGATIVFGNSTPITLPAGLFSGAIQNLTISGTGGVTVGSDLTVNGVLNLASGFLSIGARTLTLNGTTSGSGGIRGGNTSNLVIGGSGSINLRMDQTTPGTTNRLANFTYNKNTTLLDTLEVTGVITPTAGQLNTGDVLKLISTSSGTAHIATGSGSYITGKVTAERFVPATGGRRWRFMSSPVANATIEDWRGEIFVTGGSGSTTLGTTNTGGFDASPNNNPSIFSYDETNTDPSVNVGWVAPTATTEALTPGKGFRVFVRGDRSNTAMLTNSPPAVNAVTVNVVGSVNSGNIVIPITCTPSGPASTYHNNSDGWNLLGNPYPSDYDWNAFYDANSAALELFIEPTVWVYNAITGTYSSYNAESNLGGLTGGIIPSGAAFWVKAKTLGSHNITLTENFKTNTQAINVFKHTEDAGFVVRMVRDSINSSELHIKYKTGATTNFDVMDIRHLPGTVNIAAYGSDSIRLAASARPLTTLSDTIRLDVSGSNGSYTFNFFNTEYIDLLDEVYLIDNYLNQVVNLKQTNQYAFGISSSLPTTFGANRFMIVVANANPVPVSLAVFNAKVVGQKQVALDWVTVSEVNSSKFEVEHSTNGKQFNTIGNVKAQGNSAKIHNYRFIHKDAAAVNYYRLKMIDMDGSFTTSVVRMVRFDGINESEISLWPIPASQQISVNGVSNEEPVGYIVTDAMGQTVLTGMWSAHTTHELWIENLPQGMYFIKLNSETSNNTFRFIKQ